jgi:hypothetical protein
VKRYRNNEELTGSLDSQFRDRVREHVAEGPSRREEFVVLERMQGSPHSLFVESECNGADKRRRRHPAGSAKPGSWRRRWGGKGVAAAGAKGLKEDRELSPAEIANWRRGKLRQRGAAERTQIGKEGATEGVKGTSKHAGHCAPAGNFRWRDIERH